MANEDQYVGDPWTIGAEMKLRAHPDVTLISLITDEAGAQLIAKGIVPAYIRQQAKEALEWCCTEQRTPEHERSLFESDDHKDTA